MSMSWGTPNHSRDEAAAYERRQWLEYEVPKALEHAENVREARRARQAPGARVLWRLAWAQIVGLLLLLGAALAGGVVVLLLLHS